MAASEAVRHVIFGASPRLCLIGTCSYDIYSVRSNKSDVCERRKRSSVHVQAQISSRPFHASNGMHVFRATDKAHHGKTVFDRLESVMCNCKRLESVSGNTTNNQDSGRSKTDKRPALGSLDETLNDSTQHGEAVGVDILVKNEKGGFTSKEKFPIDGHVRDPLHKVSENSIEDEAWCLLRNSIVYYCNNPIGTIAANDPSSTIILNYDQVFIRDFVPSGIAFLLKGEYDIVRDFILYTLQLQVNS